MSDTTKVAFITGGGGGIGSAAGARLAHDGLNVALVDLNAEAAEAAAAQIQAETPNAKVMGVACDVADADSVNGAVELVNKELGPIGVAVNNAGVTRDNMLYKMSEDDWDTVMRVHLRGAFLVSKAAQASMVSQGWGRLINISSINALGMKGQANYATAKMGLQAFTRTLAMELGAKGITVNCIAPGYIRTPMTEAVAERLGLDPEKFFGDLAKKTPLGRVGMPEDIANAVAMVVSPDAGFMTGETLYVDGGFRL